MLPRPGDCAPRGKPCRTWTCFSRIRRLLKVRFPSVQYLQGEWQVGAKGTAQRRPCLGGGSNQDRESLSRGPQTRGRWEARGR